MLANIVLLIFLGMSVFTFIEYGSDKQAAVQGRWRKRESYMLWLSALGGAFGGLMAMNLFRHKTRKIAFWLVNGAGALVHAGVVLWLFLRS